MAFKATVHRLFLSVILKKTFICVNFAGITLVELATGVFPYPDCKSDFEVLSRVLQDDPPLLPANKNFSPEFRQFVRLW